LKGLRPFKLSLINSHYKHFAQVVYQSIFPHPLRLMSQALMGGWVGATALVNNPYKYFAYSTGYVKINLGGRRDRKGYRKVFKY